jgi:hypothetical protein
MFKRSLLPRGLSELDRSQWKMSAPCLDSILNCCKQAIALIENWPTTLYAGLPYGPVNIFSTE